MAGSERDAAGTTYLFGDMLAAARAAWVRRMAAALAQRGYPDYRRSDAALVRLLRRAGPVAVGRIGDGLGVSRQAARKLIGGLEARGFVLTQRDPADARVLQVTLTEPGRAYAAAVIDVVYALNREVGERLSRFDLVVVDAALRAVIGRDEVYAVIARRIPPP